MRWFFGIVAAILIGIGLYVTSALFAIHGLAEAARTGDGASVLARTDLMRVRRSLVDQIVTAYLEEVSRNRPVRPLERLAANSLGSSVADAMIAKLLTGESLVLVLDGGEFSLGYSRIKLQRLTDATSSGSFNVVRRISLVNSTQLLVSLGEADGEGGILMNLESGGWKLAGILLPQKAVQAVAQNLINSRGKGLALNPSSR